MVVMCTTSQCKLRSTFRNLRVRNGICIVTLPPFGSLDLFWIMRSQRSRRRDKGLYAESQMKGGSPDISFVHTHAEGHSSSNDRHPSLHPVRLDARPYLETESSVVCLRWDALATQSAGNFGASLSLATVYYAASLLILKVIRTDIIAEITNLV